MKIMFLGDVVGISGCSKIMNNLLDLIKENKSYKNEYLKIKKKDFI